MPVIPTNKQLEARIPKDFYRTPDAYAKRNVELIAEYFHSWGIKTVLDPAAGSGIFGYYLREIFGDEIRIIGCEFQSWNDIASSPFPDDNMTRNLKCYDKFYFESDFLNHSPELRKEKFDLIITNPPFNQINGFINTARSLLNPSRGIISYILRSNFLEGQHRYEYFWPQYPLSHYFLSSKRIGWANHPAGAKKKSDYETYAQYVWTFDSSVKPLTDRSFIGKIITW